MDIINAVVKEVADREGTSPTALGPMYDVIDTDALERVIDSAEDERVTVEFTYSGYVVTVAGDGGVRLDATSDAVGQPR